MQIKAGLQTVLQNSDEIQLPIHNLHKKQTNVDIGRRLQIAPLVNIMKQPMPQSTPHSQAYKPPLLYVAFG